LLDVVGSGGFGVVLSAYDNKNKRKVALKIVVKENVKGVMLQKEFEILKQMNHPNVVSIYNILNYSNFLIISMSIGIETVWDMVKRRQLEENPLTDEECSSIARGLLTGLAHIHDENNIIHRDIKEQNLLITQY
jgi:eukaryotic-like serine/threonine-protein kinase